MHYYWCNKCTSASEMVALLVVQSLALKTARIYEAVESPHSAVDLRIVKDIAGHASLKTTQRYLHSSDKIRGLRLRSEVILGATCPPRRKKSLSRFPQLLQSSKHAPVAQLERASAF
jgi:hypothetical protein